MGRVNDGERREAARRLREFIKDNQWALAVGGNSSTIRHAISDIVFGDKKYHSGVDLLDRLADLIEPTKPVDFDGFNHGIDSIYQWCFERLEGADGAEDELFCSIMSAIEDYWHPERATVYTVQTVDRKALLALADEMDRDGKIQRGRKKAGERWFIDGLDVREYARRIREACGKRAS